MRPGGDRKVDFECVREGACSIFAFVGPLTGWYRVEALERRAAGGWARQCLCRRIPDLPTLRAELRAWGGDRAGDANRVDRRFTARDARTRLKSLYPQTGG